MTNTPSQPLDPAEVNLLKNVFKAVHRNFVRFSLIESFVFIALVSEIALTIYIKPKGAAAVFISILIAGIFLWLLVISHHYRPIYNTHQKALRRDMRQNRKHTCSGLLSANGIEKNMLVYHINGQTIQIADKNTLMGWKVKRFDTLKATDITLDYLPHSRLLLNVQYMDMALRATSKTSPLNEKQIRALDILPKKDRPTQQIIHTGIVTETMFYVFPIFYFIATGIPHWYTFKRLNVRLSNLLLPQVSKDLRVGQHHQIVEFLT